MLSDAFLIVWNDVSPDVETEYCRWHRIEHMPERLAIPGFLLGRRYSNFDAERYRYLTIYEVSSDEIFRSDAYRTSLANPTPWTAQMSSQMTNFVRRVCRTVKSQSDAVAGAISTFHVDLEGASSKQLHEAFDRIAGIDGVTGVHIGAIDEKATNVRQDEMQSRSAKKTQDFTHALLVEYADARQLTEQKDLVSSLLSQMGISPVFSQAYDLALLFRPPPGASQRAT